MKTASLIIPCLLLHLNVYSGRCKQTRHQDEHHLMILAKVSSIEMSNSEYTISFTPIESYTTKPFTFYILDANAPTGKRTAEESEFHKKVRTNSFTTANTKDLSKAIFKSFTCFHEGYYKIKPCRLLRYNHNNLIFLRVDVLASTDDKLVVKFFVDPERIDFSKLTTTDQEYHQKDF